MAGDKATRRKSQQIRQDIGSKTNKIFLSELVKWKANIPLVNAFVIFIKSIVWNG